MNKQKTVLLIGGAGTLGNYVTKELLDFGCKVDVICLEDMQSSNENLFYYKTKASLEVLEEFLADKHYDGIVNFIHYENIEAYPPVHKLLISHTEHLIVLSSYRVYADEQHPITEYAPMLLDVSKDEDFIKTEKYAISKAKLEKYLNSECKGEKWTIVRPVISFSKKRFDLVTHYQHSVLTKTQNGEILPLPIDAKNLTAGLDWAGNSGKLIANLLFKEQTYGEAYTVSSGQNLTWEQVAEIYAELIGAKFKWVSLDEYLKENPHYDVYPLIYDRLFNRFIDNSKILNVTGLKKEDFKTIKEGLEIELALLKK